MPDAEAGVAGCSRDRDRGGLFDPSARHPGRWVQRRVLPILQPELDAAGVDVSGAGHRCPGAAFRGPEADHHHVAGGGSPAVFPFGRGNVDGVAVNVGLVLMEERPAPGAAPKSGVVMRFRIATYPTAGIFAVEGVDHRRGDIGGGTGRGVGVLAKAGSGLAAEGGGGMHEEALVGAAPAFPKRGFLDFVAGFRFRVDLFFPIGQRPETSARIPAAGAVVPVLGQGDFGIDEDGVGEFAALAVDGEDEIASLDGHRHRHFGPLGIDGTGSGNRRHPLAGFEYFGASFRAAAEFCIGGQSDLEAQLVGAFG